MKKIEKNLIGKSRWDFFICRKKYFQVEMVRKIINLLWRF